MSADELPLNAVPTQCEPLTIETSPQALSASRGAVHPEMYDARLRTKQIGSFKSNAGDCASVEIELQVRFLLLNRRRQCHKLRALISQMASYRMGHAAYELYRRSIILLLVFSGFQLAFWGTADGASEHFRCFSCLEQS